MAYLALVMTRGDSSRSPILFITVHAIVDFNFGARDNCGKGHMLFGAQIVYRVVWINGSKFTCVVSDLHFVNMIYRRNHLMEYFLVLAGTLVRC